MPIVQWNLTVWGSIMNDDCNDNGDDVLPVMELFETYPISGVSNIRACESFSPGPHVCVWIQEKTFVFKQSYLI